MRILSPYENKTTVIVAIENFPMDLADISTRLQLSDTG